MIHTKFLPGQDHRELMDYALYLRRCGYDRIQFRRDDSAGHGSGFLVRFEDGEQEHDERTITSGTDRESASGRMVDKLKRLAGARSAELAADKG